MLRNFEGSRAREFNPDPYKYKKLNRTAEQFFPLRFRLLMPSDSNYHDGQLDGFLQLVAQGTARFVR